MARKGDGIWRRGKAWWLEFRHQGKRYQMSLGLNISRTVAAEIAVKKRGAILSGEAGIGVKRRDLLFEKASEEFLKAAKANTRPNTYRSYDQHIRIMTDHFQGKRLGNVSAFLVEKYKQKRIAAGVAVGFNRELGTLRTLFNWCIEKGKYEGHNPTLRIKRLKESRGRERFLEPEEEERFLGACSETLRFMLMCGIYAGLRIPSEVLHLKWQDIDLKRGLLTVQGVFAKNGQTETLPLNSKLAAALQHLKRFCKSEYVFVKEDGKPYLSVQNIFRTAAKRAGLTGISPHVCRHTFASRLAMAGVDLRTIQELGRWASLSMVQRYSSLSKTHKVEAIEKLSGNSPAIFPTPAAESQSDTQLKIAINT